jgi:NAD(P)-dependent dehydrogenase (short-subunit alcohol dehydrogenase family)
MSDITLWIPDLVVVSGSASGLGLDCVRTLLRAGATVVGVDITEGPAEFKDSDRYRHVQGSVVEATTWEEVAAELGASRTTGGIGFIGAAAILQVGTLDDDVDTWRRTWEVNVLGNVQALKRLLPLMREAPDSAVVVVTSIDADFGEQQLAAYTSSKAAVSGAVRTIALDYARSGVKINLLAPGPMRAGLFERHLASAKDPAEFLATREARQPIGRIVGADEVANAAMFLLSAQASAVFGTTLVADGGLTAGFDYRTGAEGASV